MADFNTKDDGKRVVSSTGSLRSDDTGKGRFDLVSFWALTRLAKVYERGATQKGARNWEKGFNISRACSSAIRHIGQYLRGFRDEDHLAQSSWQLFCAMHFEELNEMGVMSDEFIDTPQWITDDDGNITGIDFRGADAPVEPPENPKTW